MQNDYSRVSADGCIPVGLRESLAEDRVSDLERSPLIKVHPSVSIRETIAKMQEQRCGCALVCEGSRLVGVVTERDILKRVLRAGAPLDSPVREYMTSNPVTIKADERVGQLIGRLLEGGYRHMPVVDASGEAVAIVSVKGIVHYLVSHFPTIVYNLPPAPTQSPTSREGA